MKNYLPYAHGNAGCLIKQNGMILIVKTLKTMKWCIPSGRPSNESELAHDTAARETFEETGLTVTPVHLLDDFNEEFYVYACQPDIVWPEILKPPEDVSNEIVEVRLAPIEFLTVDNVRFPCVLPRIVELFKEIDT